MYTNLIESWGTDQINGIGENEYEGVDRNAVQIVQRHPYDPEHANTNSFGNYINVLEYRNHNQYIRSYPA